MIKYYSVSGCDFDGNEGVIVVEAPNVEIAVAKSKLDDVDKVCRCHGSGDEFSAEDYLAESSGAHALNNKTLFEFIKDNWRTWAENKDFAEAHDMTPQCLNNWLKAQHTTDGERVFSGTTGKPMKVKGDEFKIRGYEVAVCPETEQ